jgi:hypothetical protein
VQPESRSAATTLVLVRDGTLIGPTLHEIDFRTPDGSVWLTIKADTDPEAERVASALEAAFGDNEQEDG